MIIIEGKSSRGHRSHPTILGTGERLFPPAGLPLILDEWPRGATLWEYLEAAVNRPISAVIVSGERALAAEFPSEAQARTVLSAIGHGERTFSLIGSDRSQDGQEREARVPAPTKRRSREEER